LSSQKDQDQQSIEYLKAVAKICVRDPLMRKLICSVAMVYTQSFSAGILQDYLMSMMEVNRAWLESANQIVKNQQPGARPDETFPWPVINDKPV
jgi:hypothetical protein